MASSVVRDGSVDVRAADLLRQEVCLLEAGGAMTDDDFAVIGALADPARRALYRYVAASTSPISRDQAAEDVGLARHTVKFHLDRLVDEGLLETEYRRLSGRRGARAGRPAQPYPPPARGGGG